MQFSPFDPTLPDGMRDATARNLRRLAELPARAPASPERPLSVAFLADTHVAYAELRRIVDLINGRPEIELVVHAGDFTNHGTALEYVWAYSELERLHAPFFVTPGNHDGLANGPLLYDRMFGPENFVVTWASMRLVFWNSNPNEWRREDPDFDWLDAALDGARPERAWIVTHQPPWSSPHLNAAQSLRLWRTLRAGRAGAYLYGHLHDGFGAHEVEGVRFLKAQAATTGAFYVLTTDGAELRLEACVLDACTRANPGAAPGTDPPPPERPSREGAP
jgi:Icc protein